MQAGIDPNQPQNQFWGGGEVPSGVHQVQSGQQQIIVLNPKYKPETNLRIISTAILVLGVLVSIGLPFTGLGSDIYILFEISSFICCSSFIIALLIDAVYLKGKSDWETSLGISNNWTLVSLILSIIFAIGLIIILIMNLFVYRL